MAGFGIDSNLIPWIIVMFLIVIVFSLVWKWIYGSKPKVQPITKNQYERIVADLTASAKNNKIRIQKWLNFTGDSTHPPLRHYSKILGTVADGRMCVFLWRVKWYTPKRIYPVNWSLIDNFDGREVWVRGNGTQKDGYFFRTVISRDHIKDGTSIEKYDIEYKNFIVILLKMQGIHDIMEQGAYEVMMASSHERRPAPTLLQKPEYADYEETYREPESELEG